MGFATDTLQRLALGLKPGESDGTPGAVGTVGKTVERTGTITTTALPASAALSDYDALQAQSIAVQIAGAFTGTVTFEVSNDGTNWVSKILTPSTGGVPTATAAAPGMWFGDLGSRYFRTRFTAWTAGTPTVIAEFMGLSTASPTQPTQAVTVSSTNYTKAEDAAAASGDLGIPALAVRAAATPVALTSAAGDYAHILVDAEGKLIVADGADPVNTWQASLDYTLAAAAVLKASAGAGLRNYITDIALENTGASPARVTISDGATRIWTATLAAGQTLVKQFKTPLRGTAATAVNVTLGAAGTVSVSASGYAGI